MNREILFRGKQISTNKFIEGSLVIDEWGDYFIFNPIIGKWFNVLQHFKVDPETVGQFTGLTDKNGNKIFEGDVLKFVGGTCDFFVKSAYGHRHEKGTIFTVKWFPSGYTLYESKTKNPSCPNCWSNIGNYDFWNNSRSFEVIGNIYDNQELLK